MRWVAATAAVLAVGCGGSPFTMATLDGVAVDDAQAGDAVSQVDAGSDAGPAQEAAPHVFAESSLEAGSEAEAEAPETGTADAPADGHTCLMDLSGVGTGDFRVAFTVTTTETGLTIALLNQRAGCTASMLWDVSIDPAGLVVAQLDDGAAAHNVVLRPPAAVNDGQPHRVVLARVSGQAQCSVDGVGPSTPDPYSYGSFPPISVGTDPCQLTPIAGHAVLSDVCVTRVATP